MAMVMIYFKKNFFYIYCRPITSILVFGQLPEWIRSQIYTIPNGHHPEWTQSRMSTYLITEMVYT